MVFSLMLVGLFWDVPEALVKRKSVFFFFLNFLTVLDLILL